MKDRTIFSIGVGMLFFGGFAICDFNLFHSLICSIGAGMLAYGIVEE